MPIEIKNKTFKFKPPINEPYIAEAFDPSNPKAKVLKIKFDQPVRNILGAALRSFNVGFTDADHNFLRLLIKIESCNISQNDLKEVEVKIRCELSDASDYFDDKYDGDIDVVVFALTGIENPGNIIMDNSQIVLKTSNGKYLRIDEGEKLYAASSNPCEPTAQFTLEILDNTITNTLDDRTLFALKANNNRYVCAENGGGQELIANREQIGPWETFSIRKLQLSHTGDFRGITLDESIAIRTYNGDFVCAEQLGDQKEKVIANKHKVASWETFIITICPPEIN